MAFEADLPQIFHYHRAGSTPPTLIYVPRCIRNFRICPQVGAPACKSSVPSMQTPKHAAQIPVTTIPHPAHTGMTGGNGAIRYYQIVDRYIVPILTVTIHAPTARVRTQTLWYDVYILSLQCGSPCLFMPTPSSALLTTVLPHLHHNHMHLRPPSKSVPSSFPSQAKSRPGT